MSSSQHTPSSARENCTELLAWEVAFTLAKKKKKCCKQFTGKILMLWACAGKKSTMNLLPNKLSKIEFLLVALHECQRVSKEI